MPDPKTPPDADHVEDVLDEELEESFPASDPPSLTRPHDVDDLEPGGDRKDAG